MDRNRDRSPEQDGEGAGAGGRSPKFLFQPLLPGPSVHSKDPRRPRPPRANLFQFSFHLAHWRRRGWRRGGALGQGGQSQAGFCTEDEAAYPGGGREARGKAGYRGGIGSGARPGGSEAGGAGVRGQGGLGGGCADAGETPDGAALSAPSGLIGERKRGGNQDISKQEQKISSSADHRRGEGGGVGGPGPQKRGPNRSQGWGSAREGAAQGGRARPSPEPRCGPGGRAAPTRRRHGLAYLRRPPGCPPLPGRPRCLPPALDPLRRPGSPAPQPLGSPTSAAAPPAPPPPEWLRKEPKAERPRPRRAGKSRAEPEAGRGSAPAPSGRGSSAQSGPATRTLGGLRRAFDGRFLKSGTVRTNKTWGRPRKTRPEVIVSIETLSEVGVARRSERIG